jgi:hypothetical protein
VTTINSAIGPLGKSLETDAEALADEVAGKVFEVCRKKGAKIVGQVFLNQPRCVS